MKYPETQFQLLTKAVNVLSKHFENLQQINPSALHFEIYQNASEGHKHNHLILIDGKIVRANTISDNSKFTKVLDFLNEENFQIYPEGCNDNHIETAVKKALKIVFS